MDMEENELITHYHQNGLLETILEKLQQQGISTANLKRKDIASVDEFHVRGAAVSEELAELMYKAGLTNLQFFPFPMGLSRFTSFVCIGFKSSIS